MSGIDVDMADGATNGSQASSPLTKPTVEIVFDTVRPPNGAPLGSDPELRDGGRLARGIAALQKAGASVGKVPAAVVEAEKKADEAPAEAKEGTKGLEVTLGEPEDGDPKVEDRSEAAAKADPEPEVKPAEAVGPDLDQIRSDLAVAQARIASMSSGDIPDEERTAWIEKPIDWIRVEVARRMGLPPADDAVDQALSHLQWELTLDRMGVAKEALPKDIQERNNTEHAERRKKLAEKAQVAREQARTQGEGRAAVHKMVSDHLEASADKFPHAAAAADLNLGGVPASEAAIYLWGEAVKRGEIKNTGDDSKDIPEALRLYDKFCKTRLGTKLQLQNATPSPANTPAASKEAANGAKKPPTVSSKQAAAAPAAKQTIKEPTGPEVIDASDASSRYRRVAAIARAKLSK